MANRVFMPSINKAKCVFRDITVKTEGEYQIIKFDISNWSGLSATGTTFEKSGTKTMLIRTGVAATLVVDDVILSTSELYN